MAMVFTLVEETKAWLSENVSSVEESAENVMLEEESDPEEIIELTEPKPTGGRWEYVIGLLVIGVLLSHDYVMNLNH